MTAKREEPPRTTDEKMDAILLHLQNLDRRDRLRTWGAFFRNILGLIPIVVLLFSVWYFYKYGDVLLQKIAQQAAQQAAAYTKIDTNNAVQQVQDFFKQAQPK